jgi:hypothetical protein
MADTTTPASFLTNPLMLDATAAALELQGQQAAATATGELLPATVRTWLARARLLEGVPFQHLVADAELLPPESIRFFFVDREWTDALTQGALSVGTVNTLDRAQLQELHAAIRDEVDTEERRVRMVGGENVGIAPANVISGFLLRSRAVSGWPALHVRAYREEVGPDDSMQIPLNDPRRMRLLRLERLAPAVLLCLFDGIPQVVWIEEPRQGIQFGVDLAPGAEGTTGATIGLRDVISTAKIGIDKPVPFRRGAPGVIDVARLAERIAAEAGTRVNDFEGPGTQPAEFAMEMLQFPFRAVFGDPTKGGPHNEGGPAVAFSALFRPAIGIEDVRAWTEAGP